MSNPKLLIVEDDEAIRTQLKYALRNDFVLSFATDRTEALAVAHDVHPAVVSLDLGLPPSPNAADEGLKALDEMTRALPSTKIVVITGNADRENALRAVQLGAFDYHLKPIDVDDLKVTLRRASYLNDIEIEVEKNAQAAESAVRFEEILGITPKMRDIFAIVMRVAKTDATVLIQGESGTGKELLARALHANSVRRTRPFVPINCGAIAETLLESELFGHEKGAYTGAHLQRKGKIEVAEGGTLFLDEIGEMSLPLQVKLLRFLQEREIERVGSRTRIKVDVRIVAATNKDLAAEMQAGRFREDLFYRLSVVILKIPPLRERGEDIVLMANAFLRRSCRELGRKVRFSPEALQALSTHLWPGNVRELENVVQRAVIMASDRLIDAGDLGLGAVEADELPTLKEARNRADRKVVIDALIRTRGNIRRAAKNLAVSRPTFHGLLSKHQINAREFR